MRPHRFPPFAAAVAAVAAIAAAVAAPPAPPQAAPGIDAEHYVFHVVIPDTGRTIGVTAVLHFRRTAPADSLRLDLHSAMRVRRVTVNGRDTTFTRDTESVRVALPRWDSSCARAAPDANDRPDPCVGWISVDAGGIPTDGLIETRDSTRRPRYFADHWPNRARHWLPVIDHPSDKATVEWRVHAPSDLRVIANGRALEESPGSGTPARSITVWRTSHPIPTYLMVIGVARLARIDLGATACGFAAGGGCVQQDVYEAPELAPVTPPGFAAAGRIVEWMSRWVAPFPYEKLSHVQSSTRFGGMENASAIFYADRAFRDMSLGERLVAHETAHQWFGNSVTPVRWADLWLSEGFATYFAALWEREARGDTAFRTALAGIREQVIGAPAVAARPVVDSAQTDLMALLNANSYQKGGFVLHMLRREVGDSAWIRAVREYYATYRHRNASTGDLRAIFERVARADLRWFFDQWLTRPGFAELTTSWTHSASGVMFAQVSQSARFGAFQVRLPVEIELPDGRIRRTLVDVPARANSLTRIPGTYAQYPRRVTFDPDGDVLARITPR